jgi:hypothetical protein
MSALKIIGIILFIAVVVLAILYYFGSKMQNEQIEQEQLIENSKQTVSILTVDKKKLKFKEAGLPAMVYENSPKRMNIMNPKIPIVKAKIGPKIINLICDPAVFEVIPLKSECKVEISGIYLLNLKTVRGKAVVVPKKKGFSQKIAGIINRGKEARKEEMGLTEKSKKG